MNFFNEKRVEALLTGRYICSKCGGLMEFEDESQYTLVCPKCGHSIFTEMYGMDDEEDWTVLYPTKDEL